MNVSIHAGKPSEPLMLVNIPRLATAYYFIMIRILAKVISRNRLGLNRSDTQFPG
jgi:hypothetical protein